MKGGVGWRKKILNSGWEGGRTGRNSCKSEAVGELCDFGKELLIHFLVCSLGYWIRLD